MHHSTTLVISKSLWANVPELQGRAWRRAQEKTSRGPFPLGPHLACSEGPGRLMVWDIVLPEVSQALIMCSCVHPGQKINCK